MFKFIKQIFSSTMIFFGSLSNVNPLEYISMNNQECKVRPEIADVNSNNLIFYPFSIKTVSNVVVIVIILVIHMQAFVFLIL